MEPLFDDKLHKPSNGCVAQAIYALTNRIGSSRYGTHDVGRTHLCRCPNLDPNLSPAPHPDPSYSLNPSLNLRVATAMFHKAVRRDG